MVRFAHRTGARGGAHGAARNGRVPADLRADYAGNDAVTSRASSVLIGSQSRQLVSLEAPCAPEMGISAECIDYRTARPTASSG